MSNLDAVSGVVSSAASTVSPFTVAVALVVVAASAAFLFWKRKPKGESLEDFVEGVTWAIPANVAPADGVFTMESLAKFNGVQLPMCLAICGKVVNVSSSGNFRPGFGYGKLWAGRETTYAMAKVSLTGEDANRMDFTLEGFQPQERTTLAGWYKHFTTKYPIVGTLKEFDDWDFSAIFEEAKTQTPFGIGKEKDNAPAATDAPAMPADEAAPAAEISPTAPVTSTTPAPGEEAAQGQGKQLVLRRGAKVAITGIDDERPELNGAVGVLSDYVAEKGRFAVVLESTGEEVLVKPGNLKDPAPMLELRRGVRVAIASVENQPELNGAIGVLLDYVADKGRFVVKLEDSGEEVLVEPAKLQEAPAARSTRAF